MLTLVYILLIIETATGSTNCSISAHQIRNDLFKIQISFPLFKESNYLYFQLCIIRDIAVEIPPETAAAASSCYYSEASGEFFEGLGQPIRLNHGFLAREETEIIIAQQNGILEIDDLFVDSSKRQVGFKIWNNPQTPGLYFCHVFELTNSEKETIAWSPQPAGIGQVFNSTLLSVRHYFTEYMIGDHVYFVCDYSVYERQFPTVKIEDNECLIETQIAIIYTEETSFGRIMGVLKIGKLLGSPDACSLEPTINLKCFYEGVNGDEKKLTILEEPTIWAITVFNAFNNEIVRQNLLMESAHKMNFEYDDLNELNKNHGIECQTRGYPKPKVHWEIAPEFKQYVKIVRDTSLQVLVDVIENETAIQVKCVAENTIRSTRREAVKYGYFRIKKVAHFRKFISTFHFELGFFNTMFIIYFCGWLFIYHVITRKEGHEKETLVENSKTKSLDDDSQDSFF